MLNLFCWTVGPHPPSEQRILRKDNLQLNDTIVQCGTNPWPNRMEGEALHPGGFTLELGEHREARRQQTSIVDKIMYLLL